MKKINLEVLTYGELKALVGSTKGMEVPRAETLLKEPEEEILFHTVRREMEITVFRKGYVLFGKERRYTSFGLDSCSFHSVEEEEVNGKTVWRNLTPDSSLLQDASWELPVFMAGEERLAHNREKREDYHTGFHLNGEDFRLGEEREEEDEITKCVREAMESLTDRQREVFLLRYDRTGKIGMKEKEIAELLGISQQGVQHSLELCKKKFGSILFLVGLM